MLCALRTNAVLVALFFFLIITFGLFTALYWALGSGRAGDAARLTTATGAVTLVVDALALYLFLVGMFSAVGMPFEMPVGDLSQKMLVGKEDGKDA